MAKEIYMKFQAYPKDASEADIKLIVDYLKKYHQILIKNLEQMKSLKRLPKLMNLRGRSNDAAYDQYGHASYDQILDSGGGFGGGFDSWRIRR